MTWSYDLALATPKDQIRFGIQDVIQEDPQFQDEEINFLYNSLTSINATILRLLERLCFKYSREVGYKIGPERVDAQQRYEQCRDLLDKIQLDVIGRHGVPTMPSLTELDTEDPIFEVGKDDNIYGENYYFDRLTDW